MKIRVRRRLEADTWDDRLYAVEYKKGLWPFWQNLGRFVSKDTAVRFAQAALNDKIVKIS